MTPIFFTHIFFTQKIFRPKGSPAGPPQVAEVQGLQGPESSSIQYSILFAFKKSYFSYEIPQIAEFSLLKPSIDLNCGLIVISCRPIKTQGKTVETVSRLGYSHFTKHHSRNTCGGMVSLVIIIVRFVRPSVRPCILKIKKSTLV